MEAMSNIEETLNARLETYGKFQYHADIAQGLKAIMYQCPKWSKLAPDMKESLEMVQHKVARILNGDPAYIDNWHDIAGYVTLVEIRLKEEKQARSDIRSLELGLAKIAKDITLFSGQQGV